MSQFLDRKYFGYKVSLRPNDPFRKIPFRIKMPHLNLFLLPYFSGSDILFNLNIKATESALPTVLKYDWQLYMKEKEQLCNAGNGIADMTTRKSHKDILDLGHFSFTYNYQLNMIIESENEKRCQTVVDFETSSRTAFQMFLLNVLFAIIGGVIGWVIGRFGGG